MTPLYSCDQHTISRRQHGSLQKWRFSSSLHHSLPGCHFLIEKFDLPKLTSRARVVEALATLWPIHDVSPSFALATGSPRVLGVFTTSADVLVHPFADSFLPLLYVSIIRRRPTSRFEHLVCRYGGAPLCHALLYRAVTWPFLDGLRAGNEMGFLGFHGNQCIMIPSMSVSEPFNIS